MDKGVTVRQLKDRPAEFEIERLQAENEKLRKSEAAIYQQLEFCGGQKNRLISERDAARAEIDGLKIEIERLKAENKQLERDANELGDMCKRLRQERDEAREAARWFHRRLEINGLLAPFEDWVQAHWPWLNETDDSAACTIAAKWKREREANDCSIPNWREKEVSDG